MSMPKSIRPELLINAYIEVFRKVYRCATDFKLDTVVMSLVGGNNFAEEYADAGGSGMETFQINVWAPAFLKVWEKNKQIRTFFMGAENKKRPNPAFSIISRVATSSARSSADTSAAGDWN